VAAATLDSDDQEPFSFPKHIGPNIPFPLWCLAELSFSPSAHPLSLRPHMAYLDIVILPRISGWAIFINTGTPSLQSPPRAIEITTRYPADSAPVLYIRTRAASNTEHFLFWTLKNLEGKTSSRSL
jgi:hypothetical protein